MKWAFLLLSKRNLKIWFLTASIWRWLMIMKLRWKIIIDQKHIKMTTRRKTSVPMLGYWHSDCLHKALVVYNLRLPNGLKLDSAALQLCYIKVKKLSQANVTNKGLWVVIKACKTRFFCSLLESFDNSPSFNNTTIPIWQSFN